jgi:hypothetical protein
VGGGKVAVIGSGGRGRGVWRKGREAADFVTDEFHRIG